MGKRSNLVVVLSSDEDGDEENINRNCSLSNSMPIRSNSKLHPRSKSTTSSTRRRGATKTAKKKPRLADSVSSSVENFSGFDEVNCVCFFLRFTLHFNLLLLLLLQFSFCILT